MPIPKEPDTAVTSSTRNLQRLRQPHTQRRLSVLFVFCLLAAATAILIWNTVNRYFEYKANQQSLIHRSVDGAVNQINQQIYDLRKSVKLFAESQINLLKQLSSKPDNSAAFDILTKRVRNEFPDSFAVTIANSKGEPFITDFEGFILDICRRDISHFATEHDNQDLFIHPNATSYHIDIMVSIDLGLTEESIFFVSFKPHILSRILINSELYNHKLMLVRKDVPGLIEITSSGSRLQLGEDHFFLTNEELSRIKYESPVAGTMWKLIDLPKIDTIKNQGKRLWIETGGILLGLTMLSIFMIRVLLRSENTLHQKNNELSGLAADLSTTKDAFIKLLERMNDAYIVINSDWKIVHVNSRATDYLGQSKEALIGNDWWEHSPHGMRRFYENYNNSMHKNSNELFEFYHHKQNKWFRAKTYPAESGIALFLEDITEKKHQEDNLIVSEKRIRAILNTALEGIITIDEGGIIESFNKAAEDIFGYTATEAIGKTVNILMPEHFAQEHNKYLLQYLKSNKKRNLGKMRELEGVRKNGEHFPIEITFGEIDIAQTRLFTGVVRDITKRKQAEQKAKSEVMARLEAESANNAKSEFLANMSHEIRTPLTAIIGFGETLLDNNQSANERLNTINTIINSGEHLLSLINDILDVSKIEAGKLETEQIVVSPFHLLDDVESIIGKQAAEKNLEFKIFYEYPLPETIISDFVRLKQILINLCANAIKFTEKGHVYIKVSSNIKKQKMHFTVQDTGIGLSEHHKTHIFQAFSQADSSTTRKYGGTGLGLSLSQQLAKYLGGNIEIESTPGIGSQFKLTIATGNISNIKQIFSNAQIPKHEISNVDAPHNVMLTGRVLLAEDNENIQQLLTMILEKIGAQVTIANNGQEAVQLAIAQEFDLVFMDMQMPIMDGIEAVEKLTSKGYTTPIIALTANALQKDKNRCLDAGCVDFVTKPVRSENLYKVAKRYLKTSSKGATKNPLYSQLLDEDPSYIDLVEKFVAKLPNIRSEFKLHIERKQWQELQHKVHELKGAGGGYGYPMVTEIARQIENSIINNNIPEVEIKFIELTTLFEHITAGLQFKQSDKKIS